MSDGVSGESVEPREATEPGAAAERMPRRGDVLEVEVLALGERGLAVARHGELRLKLRHGVPGARVRVRVLKRRRKELQAQLLETLDPGPHAAQPRCAHFGSCGGCSFQGVRYERQLEELGRALTQRVRAAFPADSEPSVRVEPVLGCPEPWAYRNKMDFTFGSRRYVELSEPDGADVSFALGLHVPGRYDKVLNIDACPIQFAGGDALLRTVRDLARERGLTPWDVREHTGLLRHLVLRKGVHTQQLLVLLVTSERAAETIDPFAAELVRRHPEITTLIQAVHTGLATVAVGEEHVLHGPGQIEEELLGVRFGISAQSFFQTNTLQAERLFELVRAAMGESARGVVYDLYSGAGVIALLLAGAAREVIGFEAVASAVRDAERSARLGGFEHVRFLHGDVLELLAPASLRELSVPRPDACVVDPPRAGLHAKVIPVLRELAPERIVYVSCNPSSAVRDLELLCAPASLADVRGRAEACYRLVSAQPVDLFPHTPHLECVFLLLRSDA